MPEYIGNINKDPLRNEVGFYFMHLVLCKSVFE